MLAQVIQVATQLSNDIISGPGDTNAVGQVKSHATAFRSMLLQQITATQQQIVRFVGNEYLGMTMAKGALNTPQQQPNMRQFITHIQGQSAALLTQMNNLQGSLQEVRNQFSNDCQALIQEQDELTQQQQKLQINIAAQSEEFRKTQEHIHSINKMSIFVPAAKLMDELGSLVQSKKTSEQQLADLSRGLTDLQKQLTSVVQNTTSVQTLQPLVSQLTNSAQGLSNTLTLLDDKLRDELKGLDSTSDSSVLLLFLTVVEGMLQQLGQEAQ